MKRIQMKGRSVEDAFEAALKVLGGRKEGARLLVLNEGKSGVLGMIGAEEAQVEVILREGLAEDARQVLQEILDKMNFLTRVEISQSGEAIELTVKGDDMGRIIGKEGAMLKSLEILVRSIVGRLYEEGAAINIDAGDYLKNRRASLERLAKEVADEVARTGHEKTMPRLDARDRRFIHMCLKDSNKVTTFSQGEGRDRRLIIAPQ